MAYTNFRVLLLGYGEMGHAMQHLLSDHHTLDIWDKFPIAGVQSVELETAAPLADFVIFCLPVNPHREVVLSIAPLLKPECICLSIAKGLDESGHTAAQIFADALDPYPLAYGLLYGPMISEEIRAGRPGFAQHAGCTPEVFSSVQLLFADSDLLLSSSADIDGISWSVILKNVYAMAFGMADELGLGDNMRGFLMVAALHELDTIVRRLGGATGTAFHLAGLGDLVTTATSESSHHHSLGRQLARGDRSAVNGEGVHTLQMVVKHGIFPFHEYPLFALLHSVVLEQRDAAQALTGFSHGWRA